MPEITRVVRMTFAPARITEFEQIFRAVAPTIRQTPGCLSVALLRDVKFPNVMATLSIWSDEAALESYRQSAFFEKTWQETRALFAAPPQASSYVTATDGNLDTPNAY